MISLEIPDELPTGDRQAIINRATIKASVRSSSLLDKVIFTFNRQQRQLVSLLGRYQLNAYAEVFSAYYTGLELAIACTITQLESNGRNIYGADPASSWMNQGPFGTLWLNPVTNDNYQWFISHVLRGWPSNGVGPKQLTSLGLLMAADKRGGAWRPQHNCAEGNAFFKALIAESGNLWTAFYHYNGSGSAAQNYANRAIGLVSTWRSRVP